MLLAPSHNSKDWALQDLELSHFPPRDLNCKNFCFPNCEIRLEEISHFPLFLSVKERLGQNLVYKFILKTNKCVAGLVQGWGHGRGGGDAPEAPTCSPFAQPLHCCLL